MSLKPGMTYDDFTQYVLHLLYNLYHADTGLIWLSIMSWIYVNISFYGCQYNKWPMFVENQDYIIYEFTNDQKDWNFLPCWSCCPDWWHGQAGWCDGRCQWGKRLEGTCPDTRHGVDYCPKCEKIKLTPLEENTCTVYRVIFTPWVFFLTIQHLQTVM